MAMKLTHQELSLRDQLQQAYTDYCELESEQGENALSFSS